MRADYSNFMEEDGEIAFSVLARSILRDSDKSSFRRLNANFQLMPFLFEVQADLMSESGSTSYCQMKDHPELKEDNAEVLILRLHFISVINDMKQGWWSSEKIQGRTYPKLALAKFNYVPQERLVTQDLQALFDKNLRATKSLLQARNVSGSELLAEFKAMGITSMKDFMELDETKSSEADDPEIDLDEGDQDIVKDPIEAFDEEPDSEEEFEPFPFDILRD